jgi:alpha-L-fucosidase
MRRRNFVKACGIGSAAMLAGPAFATGPAFSLNEKARAYLTQVDPVIAGGPFKETWESLGKYQAPAWYRDAKFGIFIHWGVYSVPAFMSEWYPRMMYLQSNPAYWHHRLKWGAQDKFGYKDFIPMFKAEKFDADKWAELFKKAGARYVVPVAEHHDGFAMYDCSFSEWNAARMGPKRDIIRELADAIRRQGMVFGLSSHRAEHWWFMNGGRKFKSDVREGRSEPFYGPAQPEKAAIDESYMKDWLARCCELVDRYQPQVFWFDWWIEQPAFEPYRKKFASYYYNRADKWGKGVVLNYKNKAFPENAAVLDLERSGLSEIRPLVWQTDTSISYISWGYIDGDKFKTPQRLIGDLVDIVSKNGVLLLNIGPKADGTIPEQAQNILLEIGKWLAINGEAIYGTRPWKIFGEGPAKPGENKTYGVGEIMARSLTEKDIRFTVKGEKLFAIVMGWPADGRVAIKSLGRKSDLASGEVSSVRLLGSGSPALKFTREDNALSITLPAGKPCEHGIALEIMGLV